MPSLREQLKSILPEWEQEQAKLESAKQINQNPKATMEQTTTRHLFKPTNNASRETFNAVRDFPNQQPVFYADMLEKKGFKHGTVRSLLYQLTNQGQFNRADNGGLTAKTNAYVPLKTNKTHKKIKKQAAVVKQQAAPVQAGIGSLATNVDGHKAGMGTFKQHQVWKPEDTVDLLTLMQAKAVHAYLQKLFGAL